MRRPVCLAVEWVAWAVWTINPTLNRNDEGPGDSSGPFFLCRSHGRSRCSTALWSCAEITQLCEYFVTFEDGRRACRFHKILESRCCLWADATQASVGLAEPK